MKKCVALHVFSRFLTHFLCKFRKWPSNKIFFVNSFHLQISQISSRNFLCKFLGSIFFVNLMPKTVFFDHFSSKIVKNRRKMAIFDQKMTKNFVSSYTGGFFRPLGRPLGIFDFFFSRNFQKLLAQPLFFLAKIDFFQGPLAQPLFFFGTRAFPGAKNGAKWAKNGSKWPPEWSKIDQKWSKNDRKMIEKWSKNDRKMIKNRSKIDQKWSKIVNYWRVKKKSAG